MPPSSLSSASPSRLRLILGAPALHFVVAGALLFVASSESGSGAARDETVAASEAREIVVDAARIRGLRRDYRLANRAEAGEAETRALVDKLVNDEILFREAVARGFEQGDRSVAWRLVQKMRFLGEDQGEDAGALYHRALELGLHLSDPVVRGILVEKLRLLVGRVGPPPGEEELRRFYEEHRSEYQQAGRVSLRQVFFDKGRRGEDGARQAAEAAAAQAKGHGIDLVDALRGDPFVMGSELAAQGRNDLTKFFGPKFAEEALALPVGSWSEPLESTYGWHLVLVEKRFDARTPELAEVRSRVEKAWETTQRDLRVAEFLERMRGQYTLRVDEAAITEGQAGA